MRAAWVLGFAGVVMAAGCGPTVVPMRVVEAPPPETKRPGPSAEEAAGEMPTIVDILPAIPLVPAGFVAPAAPNDPRPLVLLEAAAGASEGASEEKATEATEAAETTEAAEADDGASR